MLSAFVLALALIGAKGADDDMFAPWYQPHQPIPFHGWDLDGTAVHGREADRSAEGDTNEDIEESTETTRGHEAEPSPAFGRRQGLHTPLTDRAAAAHTASPRPVPAPRLSADRAPQGAPACAA